MTTERSTRRVYSAEELYRLRSTCSQPKLHEAIEEHDGEDAELVKEHVLRGSKSFAARSFRSRVSGNSLRVPLGKENRSTTDADTTRHNSEDVPPRVQVLGEIQPNNQALRPGLWRLRPSPTPTLTKKAAEAIVKAHGSPQHVRVTAGGRIVPSEQSPLCHPRYGYSAIKANGGLVKFAPNHPMGQKQQWTQATQNGFVAQDVEGRLCQIVNGTILPLNEVDGALRLYIPAPNLNIDAPRTTSFGPHGHTAFGGNEEQQRSVSQASRPAQTEPSSAAQANALELEYSKLEHELRELDKTEVLHGRTMGKAAKDALVSKRRELVVSMDNIRRAIKGLKSQPPSDAPTSPRASQQTSRQSMSPPPGRNRLPPFLQHRMNETAMPPMPSAFSGFLSALPGHGQNGTFGFQPALPSDAPFVGQPFGLPPPGMYVPPPAFDGPVGQALGPQHGQMPSITANGVASNEDGQIPQTDGAWSLTDRKRVASPRGSRAVDIKAPEPKHAAGLKSRLNPMSPAYKPGLGVLHNADHTAAPVIKSVKDRAQTPLSPLHQTQAVQPDAPKNANASEHINSSSKPTHMRSSSISSFQTADFFPKNTREYSTRRDEYPDSAGKDEDKENLDPLQTPATPEDERSTYAASDPARLAQTPGFGAPAAPPGTPMSGQATHGSLPMSLNMSAVPNRHLDNVSPKGKRQTWTFVQEHPEQSSSASMDFEHTREELCVTVSPEKLDFTQASVEWLEGYRAGLGRKSVGADKSADFMDGYCAGMLKSKPVVVNVPSNGSPKKVPSRRPSPAALLSRPSSQQNLERRQPTPVRPALENTLQSMDTLKEAILAPQNENAILTPAAEGPHISDTSYNLGAWAKTNGNGYPFPGPAGPAVRREAGMPEDRSLDQQASKVPPAGAKGLQNRVLSSTGASIRSNAMSSGNDAHRIGSTTSIDANLYRQYPGHRVFSSNLEWRSASSVAQAAGMATGSFTNAQYDGASNSIRNQPGSTTAATQLQQHRVTSTGNNSVMMSHSRFREASLDGITDPTVSSPPMSPPMSPTLTAKDNTSPHKSKKGSTPVKTTSPAKAKFENIAEKVGIKVTKDGSPTSPPGKRRWRSVWLGGKKEESKDDGA